MILYDFKWGLNEPRTLEWLTQAFEDLALSRATVFRWFAEFKRGRISLKDEEKSRRPTSVVTEENISAVEALIKENPRRTYKDIEGVLGVSSPSVSTILHQHLRARKISSRWVPHHLSDGLKCTRVEWCTWNAEEIQQRGLPPDVRHSDRWRHLDIPVWPRNKAPVIGLGLSKVKRQRSVGKKMVATFFSTSGHLATVVLEDQRTVTAKWYRNLSPPQVFSKIQEKRPRTGLRGILLHHDNASSRTANATIAFLEKTPVKLNDSSSLQSRPGPVWLFPVPEREESHMRTPISQARRCCCCLPWGAKCNIWERAAWLLPEVVSEDAVVYRMCWRVLWKDVIGKETLSLSIVAYLKTYLVTLGSAGNRRQFSDEWIRPPDDVQYHRQLVAITIVAHWIISTQETAFMI